MSYYLETQMSVKRIRVLQISFLAIFSAFLVELVLGLISNSLAFITDSIHALLDAVVTVILLLAARMALRPPDAEHTYGHGKIESLGGLFGGIAILLIACFFIYESLNRLQRPPPEILPGILAIAAGVYTVGIDLFRIFLLRRSIRETGGSTVKADYYHAVMDLGSTTVAIIGIVLVSYGLYQGDFVAALILGGLLAALSIKLIHKTAMELTDAISPEMVGDARRIASGTDGVVSVGQVLMRRSGDVIFADITVSLRGDTSFERAHEISSNVERNVKERIPTASTTVHFEPNWSGVPMNAKILDVAGSVDGVMGVHNISTYKTGQGIFSDLHVMVDSKISLSEAHRISEIVEENICRAVPEIRHATIHIEPFVKVPEDFNLEDTGTAEQIRGILEGYPQVTGIGRIVSLKFGGTLRIDIDCSFDGGLSIESVHDITTEIEHRIRTGIKNSVITIHSEPG